MSGSWREVERRILHLLHGRNPRPLPPPPPLPIQSNPLSLHLHLLLTPQYLLRQSHLPANP
ncbi:hypothetical protein ACSBR2_003836 [Camellia fascicularis]